MKHCTKKLFISLIALFTAWVAFTNAQGTVDYDVTTWSPFGKLRLQELSIMIWNNTTWIDLEEYIVKIKTNSWQIRVNEICNKDGQNCKAISSITTWSNYWTKIGSIIYNNPWNYKVNLSGWLTVTWWATSIYSANGVQFFRIQDNMLYFMSGDKYRFVIRDDWTRLYSPDQTKNLMVTNTWIYTSSTFYNWLSVTWWNTNIYDKSGVQRLLINKDWLYYKSGSIYRLQIIGNWTKLFSPDQNKYLVINDTWLYVSGKFYNWLNVTWWNTNIYSANGIQQLYIDNTEFYYKSGGTFRLRIRSDWTLLIGPNATKYLKVSNSWIYVDGQFYNWLDVTGWTIKMYSTDGSKSMIIKNNNAITTRWSLIAYASNNKYQYSMTDNWFSVNYSDDGSGAIHYSTKFIVNKDKTQIYDKLVVDDKATLKSGLEVQIGWNGVFWVSDASARWNPTQVTAQASHIALRGDTTISGDFKNKSNSTPTIDVNKPSRTWTTTVRQLSSIKLLPSTPTTLLNNNLKKDPNDYDSYDIRKYMPCDPNSEWTILYARYVGWDSDWHRYSINGVTKYYRYAYWRFHICTCTLAYQHASENNMSDFTYHEGQYLEPRKCQWQQISNDIGYFDPTTD